MKVAVDKLFALQELQFGPGTKDSFTRMGQIRRTVEAELLAKYDRFASRGKKPVAIVRNGVCSQCHIRLAVGVMFQLTQGEGTNCDTCGRFLRLEDAPTPKHADLRAH